MSFLTKIDRGSNPIFELEDIERMTRYKTELINSLVYDPPQNLSARKKIAQEASNVDRWLADKFKEFMNDNNRKLAP